MKMYYKLIIACTIAGASVACLNMVNSARITNSSDRRRRSLEKLARRESVLGNMPEPVANFASEYLDFMNFFSPENFSLDYYQDYIDVTPEENREYDSGLFNLTKEFLDTQTDSKNGSGFENLLSTNFSDLFSPSTGEQLGGARFPINALGITPQESQLLLPVAKFNMLSLLDGSGMMASMQKAGTLTVLEDPDNQKFTYETEADIDKAKAIEALNMNLRAFGYPGIAGPKSDVEIYDYLTETLTASPAPLGIPVDVDYLVNYVASSPFPGSIVTKFEEAESNGDPIIYESLIESYKLNQAQLAVKNELLASSPWPCTFRHPTAQSSSLNFGPTVYSNLILKKLNKSMITNNPIELLYGPPRIENDDAVAATEVAEGTKTFYDYVWGSSWTSVFKLKRTATTLDVADHIEKNTDDIFDDKLHGRYSLVTADGRYIVCANQSIKVYENDLTNPDKIVESPNSYTIGTDSKEAAPPHDETNKIIDGEVIKGINMLKTGEIVWVTSKGRVGVINYEVGPEAGTTLDWVMLGTTVNDTKIDVYNGIIVGEDSKIYVASNKYLHKIEFAVPVAGANVAASTKSLIVINEVPYDVVDADVNLAEESPRGTKVTPTYMGSAGNGHIVLIDSAPVSNLVVFHVSDLSLEAREPITFGNTNPKNTIVDHSVLVHGWKIVVVNSTPTSQSFGANLGFGRFNFNMANVMKSGEPALSMVNEITKGEAPEKLKFDIERKISNAGMDDIYDLQDPESIVNKMRLFGESEKGVLRAIGAHMDMANMKEMKMKMPILPQGKPFSNFLASMPNSNSMLSRMVDSTPFGIQQFEFNSQGGEKKLRTTWVNNDVSIPNGIPTVSIPLGIMYGIGKRNPFKRDSGPVAGEWTLEAINWDTGKSVFTYSLGGGPWTHTAYGSTQIGPDGEIMAATANGIVRIRPEDATKLARQFNKAQTA